MIVVVYLMAISFSIIGRKNIFKRTFVNSLRLKVLVSFMLILLCITLVFILSFYLVKLLGLLPFINPILLMPIVVIISLIAVGFGKIIFVLQND